MMIHVHVQGFLRYNEMLMKEIKYLCEISVFFIDFLAQEL